MDVKPFAVDGEVQATMVKLRKTTGKTGTWKIFTIEGFP